MLRAPRLLLGALCFALTLVLLHGVARSVRRPASDGVVQQICEVICLFRDVSSTFFLFTEDNVAAFVGSCRAVFPGIEEAARKHLVYAKKAGTLLPLLSKETPGAPRPETDPERCAGTRHKTAEELREEVGVYLKAGIGTPLVDPPVRPVAEVQLALQNAEIMRFDARTLLPPHMFNVTLADISSWHPAASPKTIAWEGLGFKKHSRCFGWLTFLARCLRHWGPRSFRAHLARKAIVPLLLRFSCPRLGPTLEELGWRVPRYHAEQIPFNILYDNGKAARAVIGSLRKRRADLPMTNINVRHLPNLTRGLDIPALLGIGSVVEHVHSLLYMGHTAGGFHPDQQDNLLLVLSGEVEIVAFPANCTGAGVPQKQSILLEWLKIRQREGRSWAPFHHFTLRAGDGVVLPSFTFHKVISRDSRRIAMNAFFEPRFRQMRWPAAPANFYLRQDPTVAAARVLWTRSLKHLWDTKRKSMAMHTERNEFI